LIGETVSLNTGSEGFQYGNKVERLYCTNSGGDRNSSDILMIRTDLKEIPMNFGLIIQE
jgi:hypothetical protein